MAALQADINEMDNPGRNLSESFSKLGIYSYSERFIMSQLKENGVLPTEISYNV